MTTTAARNLMLLLLSCCLPGCGQTPEPVAGLSDQTPAELQARIDRLDRDIAAVEALRAIKRLQWAYGHYSEFGLWHDFADLFADTGIGHYTQGDLDREAIRALFLDEVGQGQLGLAPGRIYPHISFSPVLSLADDGREAMGRFRILAMLGAYGGNAIWFHGVYENAYVNERGVWKIDEVSNAAQVSGTFAAGLSSQAGDVPVIALHFTPDEIGLAALSAPSADAGAGENLTAAAAVDPLQRVAGLPALQQRLDRLDDEAAILNLQHRYGYYLDRHDWDALTALFSEQGRFEPGLQGVYLGRASIRRALNQFGDAPLAAGAVDDHILFQPYVSIAADGRSAKARVDQLGLQGTPGVSAQWTQGIYENTFIKEGGAWRIQSLHYYPRLITDYAKGWGADAQSAPGPSADFPADEPASKQYGNYPAFHIPAFHFAHPVTGRPPQYPAGDPAIGEAVGFAEAGQADSLSVPDSDSDELPAQLMTAESRVQRALAFDAVENLIDAYAYYLDECLTPAAAALFAETGEIRIAGSESGAGREIIASALRSAYCPAESPEGDFSLHHVTQPVITIADDGRTASFEARLWEIHVSNETADTYRSGKLEGEARNDEGHWRLSALDTRYHWTIPVDPAPSASSQ